ncbi:DNA-directed RNA polymerase specialized sigma24 family protein [Conyzicola nivalis]|jgi:DNA-directed RNA polymerase specialized sigma24 family protein|uniref:DNA-directed RNA polymerase specialized sigma24 family protein n=1 Tax=Conyzicola nivalis TaxID=1477021 RepID=A0ABV2QS82_9MICO
MFNPTINLDHATDALDALSPEHRQSIHLSFYAGFSNDQVADLLGVPVAVVEERLHDGLASLCDAMAIAA